MFCWSRLIKPFRISYKIAPRQLVRNSTKLSHVVGSKSIDLIEDSIEGVWSKQVQKFSSKTLLVDFKKKKSYSWKEIDKLSSSFARGLKSLGFEKGDRLGVWIPNNVEWLICQITSAKLGLILVNVNPAYRKHELQHSINLVEMKGLVLTPNVKTSDYIKLINEIIPDLGKYGNGRISCSTLPSLEYLITIGRDRVTGMHRFEDLLISGSSNVVDKSVRSDDPINIQFTSGTTGLPKGATLSNRNIINNGYFVGACLEYTEHDSICVPVPLYHCFGCVMANLAAITHGCKLVYPSEVFNPETTLAAVESEKCTSIYGVPTMFIAELGCENFKNYNLTSLRKGIMAGSPCPIHIMNRVIDEMGCTGMTIAYGMTETSPVSFQTRLNDPIERRVKTVGLVHNHVEAKIIDEDGNTVPRNVLGELCTKGYLVMLGYWKNEEKTKESIDEEGFMHTGDLAVLDDEGYCQIVGRIKDMYIRGGENVFPKEVEDFLHTHPDIENVSVVGVPDEKYGEEGCAFIILKSNSKLTEVEIKEFCKGAIAHQKTPRHVRFVKEFPLTYTKKIQKFMLKEIFEAEFK